MVDDRATLTTGAGGTLASHAVRRRPVPARGGCSITAHRAARNATHLSNGVPYTPTRSWMQLFRTVQSIRSAGPAAFDGVHLIPVSRHREIAARLEHT